MNFSIPELKLIAAALNLAASDLGVAELGLTREQRYECDRLHDLIEAMLKHETLHEAHRHEYNKSVDFLMNEFLKNGK